MKWSSLTEEEQEYSKECIFKVFEEFEIIPDIDVGSDDYLYSFDCLTIMGQFPPTINMNNYNTRIHKKLNLLYMGQVSVCLRHGENEMIDLICKIILHDKEDTQGYIQVLDEDYETAQKEYKKVKQQHLNYIENCLFPLSLNGPVSK